VYYSGRSVSGVGDVNGDGFDDFAIGAYMDEDGGSEAGQTYVIFGHPNVPYNFFVTINNPISNILIMNKTNNQYIIDVNFSTSQLATCEKSLSSTSISSAPNCQVNSCDNSGCTYSCSSSGGGGGSSNYTPF